MRNLCHQPGSLEANVYAAICVLALVTERPQELDKILSGFKSNSIDVENVFQAESQLQQTPGGLLCEDDAEELELFDVDDNVDGQLYLASLRNKVLDRLAEVLARFKTHRTGRHKGSFLDPKHVSAAFMVMCDHQTRVEIYCAKNEGLDQQGGGLLKTTAEDTDFLECWRKQMQCIAEQEPAADVAKLSLLDLIVEYQRPRVIYYIDRLRQALLVDQQTRVTHQCNATGFSEESLRKIRPDPSRIWSDDNGIAFEIPVNRASAYELKSEAAVTGDSLLKIDDEISSVFDKVTRLCQLDLPTNTSTCFTKPQMILIQETMTTSIRLWKSVRHESAIKARLHNRFLGLKTAAKRGNTVMMALRFLCRTQLAVETFIEAAEKMSMFRSIKCVPIHVPPRQSPSVPSQKTPLDVLRGMGVHVTGDEWVRFLQKQKTLEMFRELRMNKRFVHAELQALCHYNTLFAAERHSYSVHPYIGCSKLCCLLCYFFITAHGQFSVRGTHETVMHRWEIPPATGLSLTTTRFFNIVVDTLRGTLKQPFSRRHGVALAQSSAAMSTARTVSHHDLGQMERSSLDLSRLMMMPTIIEGGLIINNWSEEPGYAYVLGGDLGNGRKMAIYDADIYAASHFRSNFGMEKLGEMPQKRRSISRTCRYCKNPSALHCSACRVSYCSRRCQHADWKGHVFTCTIKGRPNDFDRLGTILSQTRLLRNEVDRSVFLVALFSDDHLCRMFGFVNCIDYEQVMHLLSIWRSFIRDMKPNLNEISTKIENDEANLGGIVEIWARVRLVADENAGVQSVFIPWFLKQRATLGGFNIPEWERQYAYQLLGVCKARLAFSMDPEAERPASMTDEECIVMALYTRLFKSFNNIPDASNSEWINFGFCFCKTNTQRKKLARLYLELAESDASLAEITEAWMTSTLPTLMTCKGLNHLKGMRFEPPDPADFAMYRLMAEVSHALSGLHCPCFRPKLSRCQSKYESHLSIENDIEYGFHGTNAWERWQLLNFYKHVFRLSDFDAEAMQRAKQSGREAFEGYLDTLVPAWRRKIGDRVLADAMFPKLGERVKPEREWLGCRCIAHDLWTPEGLNWMTPLRVCSMVGQESDESSEEGKGSSS